MTYKNPRLKHVKKIETYAREVNRLYLSICHIYGVGVETHSGFTYCVDNILNQCNLLLETKKKKNKKCTCNVYEIDGKTWVSPCGIHKLKPSPQIEKKCECTQCQTNRYGGAGGSTPHIPSPQPEIEPINLPSETEISSTEAVYCLEHKLNEVIDRLNKLTKTK